MKNHFQVYFKILSQRSRPKSSKSSCVTYIILFKPHVNKNYANKYLWIKKIMAKEIDLEENQEERESMLTYVLSY